MILPDTSVWIDHLRRADNALAAELEARTAIVHPYVIGEIAVGSIRQRELVILMLQRQNQAPIATHAEVMQLIESERLYGLGIGYVDVHLLASVRLTPGCSLWTRDKRLNAVAQRLGLAAAI